MRKRDLRRGMVLVVVLWTIALLSALAMAAATTFRGFAGVMVVDQSRVQSQALLTAGVEIAAGHIANLGEERPLMPAEFSVQLITGRVQIQVSDEGGRIDIDKAPVELLESLFAFTGAQPDVASAMAGWVEDVRKSRRGSGQQASPGGVASIALSALMRGTGAGAPPPDWPFSDPRQLIQIPQMQPEWVEALLPITTVYGNKTINPLTAPASVIASLPDVSRAAVAAFLEARASKTEEPDKLRAILGASQKFLEVKKPRAAFVRMVAELKNGSVQAAEATIAVMPGDIEPYRILAWNPLPYDRGRAANPR